MDQKTNLALDSDLGPFLLCFFFIKKRLLPQHLSSTLYVHTKVQYLCILQSMRFLGCVLKINDQFCTILYWDGVHISKLFFNGQQKSV